MKKSPKRLVVIHNNKNTALTLSSIFNCLDNGHYKLEDCLILSEDFKGQEKTFKSIIPAKLELQIISNMNDLINEDIQYEPNSNDVILVPFGTLFHFGKVLTKVERYLMKNKNDLFFLCHLKPDGKSSVWYGLQLENDKLRTRKIELERNSTDDLSWIFNDKLISFNNLKFDIPKDDLQSFVDFENSLIYSKAQLEKRIVKSAKKYITEKRPSFLFEYFAAKILSNSEYIAQLIMNITFDAEWKSKVFDKIYFREEDIIMITKEGMIIYASCKFLLADKNSKIKIAIKDEIRRMSVLKLRIKFPQERIVKLIICSSKAKKLFPDNVDGVYLTNLFGINNFLESIHHTEEE